MDYKENLKYQYFFKLVDAMSERLYESLMDRMTALAGSLVDMKSLIENQRVTKDHLVRQFASMQTPLTAVLDQIRDVERLMESQSIS
jgi:hypothetical protein